jgi:hypothetical protein
MNPRLLQALSSAGWFPGRLADVAAITGAILGEGFHVSERAREFLGEYGGLLLVQHRDRGPWDAGEIRIGADAARSVDASWAAEYGRRLAERVTPVGTAARGHLTIYLSEGGVMLGGFDDELVKLGGTPEEGLACMLDGIMPSRL